MRPQGIPVLQIPVCIFSFFCSALLLILQCDGGVVKWCPEIFERQSDAVLAYFVLPFAECAYARAAAFLGASCLSDYHSN